MTFPILGGNSAVSAGAYSIDNSLRFNQGDSPVLSKTPSSSGNQKTMTFSFWIKRSHLDDEFYFLYSAGASAINRDGIRFYNNSLDLIIQRNDYDYYRLLTTAKFRDVSAWYHIVIAIDTTDSTSSNRFKMYVNGSQITDFQTETYPPQNLDLYFNENSVQYIGRFYSSNSNHYDGYIADYHFIDGSQKAPTDFGEFDSTSGIWKPKAYTGSYGTNGFYLDFEDSSSLGNDVSGNNNDFTPTNLASTDQTTDTSTNNFATLNPLNLVGGTLSEGNLYYLQGSNWNNGVTGTQSFSSGKWYWEARVGGNYWFIGIQDVDSEQTANTANGAYKWTYAQNAKKYNNTVYTSYGATYAANDIISVAYDADNGTLTFYKNGSSQGTAFSGLDTSKRYTAFVNCYSSNLTLNFGQEGTFNGTVTSQGNADENGYGDFFYAPPTGYLSLCSANLATALSPTIDDGSAYFQTAIWTGTGSSQTITNDGNSDLQPDFVWIKCRSVSRDHVLLDSTRGGTKVLSSHSSSLEATDGAITSFNTDGFTHSGQNAYGGNGETHVGWQWKANAGTTSSNTDGDITTTVQANTTSGFSILTWTGNGSASQQLGHGLGVTPKFFINKNRDASVTWQLFGSTVFDRMQFNTEAEDENLPCGFSSTTITLPNLTNNTEFNSSGDKFVSYVFAEIEGYSKIGSYTGNGADNDGPMVYLGFKPSFLLVKNLSNTGEWGMFDSARNTFNVVNARIEANSSGTEYSGDSNRDFDFLSNGFKVRNGSADVFNTSGDSFLYMCFAENPFVDSNGVPNTAR